MKSNIKLFLVVFVVLTYSFMYRFRREDTKKFADT